MNKYCFHSNCTLTVWSRVMTRSTVNVRGRLTTDLLQRLTLGTLTERMTQLTTADILRLFIVIVLLRPPEEEPHLKKQVYILPMVKYELFKQVMSIKLFIKMILNSPSQCRRLPYILATCQRAISRSTLICEADFSESRM